MSVQVALTITNIATPAGLKALNEYLQDKSFITGYALSQNDVAVLKQLNGAPDAEKYPNLARWYSHVTSFSEADQAKFPGTVTVTFEKADVAAEEEDDDDEDIDLFGDDDEEDEEYKAAMEKKKAEAADKKKKKAAPVGKSSVLFDIKPWEADTDMKAMEEGVRAIQMEGLTWGGAQLVDVAFGVKKLSILCTIVDDLVPSTDDIIEPIEALEDYVQSVDIAAFNKV